MHLNGFVDVMSKMFLDVVIQPGQHPDERQALHTMLDHFDQDEFDVTVKRFVTNKRNKIMKEQPDIYLYMNPTKNIPHFPDFLISNHLGYLSFRVLKIRTSETTCEYLITNLPDSFNMNDIKDCYHWRWGIETAFRYLKHAAGLLYFHSKKPEFLRQEIFASLVLYNFGILLANEANAENQRKDRRADNKHISHVDFSTVLRNTTKYFRRRPGDKRTDIIKLLCKFVHAVKEDFRQFDRPLQGIGAIHFSYR